MQPTTVTIMNRQPILRDGLTLRLSSEADLQVLAAVSSPGQVIGMILQYRPDVLVLDTDIGEEGCAELWSGLRSLEAPPRVILLTSRDDAAPLVSAIRMGASACVLKISSIENLTTIIRCVVQKDPSVPPPLLAGSTADLLELPKASDSSNRLATLTLREMEVLDLMVEGLNHAELARRLYVTVNTIRTHTRNIQMKLDVHSTLGAVAVALQAGIRPSEAEHTPMRHRAQK